MKTILCYGDSNTWGLNPKTQNRFPRSIRWPGRLQTELGSEYYVIEEGLCGRTTVWEDPIEEYKNGKSYLVPCLHSHKPIDLVILMLGTNDMKQRFSLPPIDIAAGVTRLINTIQLSQASPVKDSPQILLLAPPHIEKMDDIGESIFKGAFDKSRQLADYYYKISLETQCSFFDTSTIINADKKEGLHLNNKAHGVLATKIKELVLTIFNKKPFCNENRNILK